MAATIKRFKNVARVLTVDARETWLTLLPLAAMLLLPGLLTCRSEDMLRYSGLLLQLAGLVVVAIGIRDTRRLFGRPTLVQIAATWFERLRVALRNPPAVITARGSISLSGSLTLRASGTATLSAAPRSIEERVASLEKAADGARERLNALHDQIQTSAKGLRDQLAAEERARQEADGTLRHLLEDQAAGGLHLETMGLCWLLVGTIVGSLTTELSRVAVLLPCRP